MVQCGGRRPGWRASCAWSQLHLQLASIHHDLSTSESSVLSLQSERSTCLLHRFGILSRSRLWFLCQAEPNGKWHLSASCTSFPQMWEQAAPHLWPVSTHLTGLLVGGREVLARLCGPWGKGGCPACSASSRDALTKGLPSRVQPWEGNGCVLLGRAGRDSCSVWVTAVQAPLLQLLLSKPCLVPCGGSDETQVRAYHFPGAFHPLIFDQGPSPLRLTGLWSGFLWTEHRTFFFLWAHLPWWSSHLDTHPCGAHTNS